QEEAHEQGESGRDEHGAGERGSVPRLRRSPGGARGGGVAKGPPPRNTSPDTPGQDGKDGMVQNGPVSGNTFGRSQWGQFWPISCSANGFRRRIGKASSNPLCCRSSVPVALSISPSCSLKRGGHGRTPPRTLRSYRRPDSGAALDRAIPPGSRCVACRGGWTTARESRTAATSGLLEGHACSGRPTHRRVGTGRRTVTGPESAVAGASVRSPE